jgi:hypothetical protein
MRRQPTRLRGEVQGLYLIARHEALIAGIGALIGHAV